MATNRKLQGEIDRVLKQITEHMAEFDVIWSKVHSAPTPNLKEKYESDLKKEIKKLQRFRDQLKSWAANSDIKNKKPLLDARRAIETEMERFKVLEKETKTKAYSKEGLLHAARKHDDSDDDGYDPRDDPSKAETFTWLDAVQEQLEKNEEELREKADGAKDKKKNKSKNNVNLEEVTKWIERHEFHIGQIKKIKEKLEGDSLDVQVVEDIREDLEYYANSYNEPDFQEDETLYDLMELNDDEEEEETTNDAAPSEEAVEEQNEEEAEEEEEEQEDLTPGSAAAILKAAGAKLAKAKPPVVTPNKSKPAAAPTSSSTQAPAPVPLPLPIPSPAKPGTTLASIVKSQSAAAVVAASTTAAATVAASNPSNAPPNLVKPVPRPGDNKQSLTSTSPSLKSQAPSGSTTPAPMPGMPPLGATPPGLTPPTAANMGAENIAAFSHSKMDRSMLADDYLSNLGQLDVSFKNIPELGDSERPKQYVPRNPYRTPTYFPSSPAPIFDEPMLFEKLSVDTLFFIFYFQQGTPHQYLAARELKKQSWRYHKNFLTWFQRHDDPKLTTEEYEQGTYVYFDYESGWCQRIKSDFTFEYRHLEDELSVPSLIA